HLLSYPLPRTRTSAPTRFRVTNKRLSAAGEGGSKQTRQYPQAENSEIAEKSSRKCFVALYQ
ncbi:hypothetical protein, partial [Anianabacter salinae]|uniref:hypothetical protein n=1 Tax=Anianabacter salinae TaxID=2851023 RepID=UPI00225E516A